MNKTPKVLVLAVSLIGLPAAAWAADEAQLPTVEVKGERVTERPAFQKQEIGSEEIRQRNAVDLKTALKDIPGVDVLDTQGTRQGNDSVNIRGLSGNRVAMSLDGIDLPEANENKGTGQFVIFGRSNFVDVSSLRDVDISKTARGFGLGGAVEMTTVSPSDILQDNNRGGYVDTQYNSVDRSVSTTAAGALQRGDWRGMVLATWRKGHETDNRGDVDTAGATRTAANPADYNSRYFLTKQEYSVNDNHTLNFAAEYLNRNQWTNQLSNVTSTYPAVFGSDENKRIRLSLGHQYSNADAAVQEGNTQIYWQRSQTDSSTHRDYSRGCTSTVPGTANPCEFAFNNQDQVFGLNSDWTARLNSGSLNQEWHFGTKLAYHDLTSDWAGYYAYSKPTADSKAFYGSVYADGDLRVGRLTVSPGLSLHYYRINPNTDGYNTNTGNLNAASLGTLADVGRNSRFAATPRFGLSYEITPMLVPYFQYARGFKAPSPQQLAFTWNPGTYSIWGNPNLKPETANNFELGLRGKNDVLEYGIAGFSNYYRNFIDYADITSLPLLNPKWGMTSQIFTMQAQNFRRAHIYGGEAYAKWRFAPNWQANGSLAYSRGSMEIGGVDRPLNSVMPLKVKLGLAYERETWGGNINLTYAAKKDDKDLYSVTYNPSRSYTLVDLGGYWQPTKHLSLRAGVNNLFNQKYWNWADIAYLYPDTTASYSQSAQKDSGVPTMTSANADFFTAPGRTFNIGLRYTF